MSDIFQNIEAALLEPLQQAMDLIGEAAEKIGQAIEAGGEIAGEAAQQVGEKLEALAKMIEQLQAKLRAE